MALFKNIREVPQLRAHHRETDEFPEPRAGDDEYSRAAIDATARVEDVIHHDEYVGTQPVVTVRMMVRRSLAAQPYETAVTLITSSVALSRLTRGAHLAVTIAPADGQVVSINWPDEAPS